MADIFVTANKRINDKIAGIDLGICVFQIIYSNFQISREFVIFFISQIFFNDKIMFFRGSGFGLIYRHCLTAYIFPADNRPAAPYDGAERVLSSDGGCN